MTDAELVALVLGSSTRGSGGVVQTARALLGQLGGLGGLARAGPGALMRVPGIGAARACALCAVVELARRMEAQAIHRGDRISSSARAYRRVKGRLSLLDQETFLALALDVKQRLLAVITVAQGTSTSVEVLPRDLFRALVREGAVSVIVAHNHPSGDPEPSADDRALTLRLGQSGTLLGIELLDHLVVGAGSYVSLAERGML